MTKERQELLRALTYAAHDINQLNDFLIDLLTPAELADCEKRFQVVKLLNEGIVQRDIAQKISVSISKITRGSRVLSNPKGGFTHVLAWWRSTHRT